MVGHLSVRDCMKGTVREASFSGEPERSVKQGTELGVCLHRGPTFGEHGGTLLSYGLLI